MNVKKLIKRGHAQEFIERNPTKIDKNVKEIISSVIPIGINEVKALVPYLKAEKDIETVLNIHVFVRKHVRRVADKRGTEYIRFPYLTLKDGKGDCEDISGLIASLLSACDIKSKLRVAECDDGYKHIYNIVPALKLVVDGTLPECGDEIETTNFKDYPLKLSLGLGKIPQSIWSKREEFIATLWKKINKDFLIVIFKENKIFNGKVLTRNFNGEAITYEKVKVQSYKNTFPQEIENPSTLENYIYQFQEVQKVNYDKPTQKLKITLKTGQIFSINPYYLADINYKISGGAGMKLPKEEEKMEEITAKNISLMKMMLKFSSNDALRPAYNGVHFLKNGKESRVETTDGHRVFAIIFDSEEPIAHNGLFDIDGKLIEEKFPKTEPYIIDYTPALRTFTIKRKELITIFKQILPVINKATSMAKFSFSEDKTTLTAIDVSYASKVSLNLYGKYVGEPFEIGVNIKLFLPILENVSDENNITLEMREYNSPILMNGNNKYGRTTALIMPVMFFGDPVTKYDISAYEILKIELFDLKL